MIIRLFFIFILCLLITDTTLAGDLLVKITLDNLEKLPQSVINNCTFRFQGQSFLLAQGDETLFARNSSFYTILDRVKPGSMYYMLWTGHRAPYLSQSGDILLRFGNSVLLRADPSHEPELINQGLSLIALPESIKLSRRVSRMAPGLADSAADSAIIMETVNAVSADNLKRLVFDLQENKDLDPPHNAYGSRYCLRVQETDDPSDDACDNAADYIYNKFKEYGLDVKYDPFPHEVLTQGNYQMQNVVATLSGKGADSQKVFIISAHYDSAASKSKNWLLDWKKLPAPGADDNASGTAAVLEAARILSKYGFNATIKFIAFSGEELRLHGSLHYVKQAIERNEEIAGVLDLDMIAYDPDVLDIDIITNLGSEWIAEAMMSVQKKYNIGPLILKKIVNADMVYSDHAPFWQNGYNAILGIDNSNFESPEFYPFMHSADDTVDKLNFDMAARMVQVSVATLASLADPLDEVMHPDLAITDSDVFLSSENPDRGQSIQLFAKVRNTGKADAEGISIQIWLEEPLSKTQSLVNEQIVNLKVNESAEITASLKLMDWGDYKVIVKVNPDYRVFETDGRNNIAVKTIRVSSKSLALGKIMIYPNPVNTDDKVNIAYTLSKDASTSIEIYSILGDIVYQKYFISGGTGGRSGANKNIAWDGKNMSGGKVASGVYLCHVTASDDDGNTAEISKKFVIVR